MEAFQPLYAKLWKFILSISRNRDDAKDILSETFLIAYEKFDTLKNERAFLSFLFTIASRLRNASTNKRKKYYSEEVFDFDDFAGNFLSPEDETDIKLLYKTLDYLPDAQKEAIVLFEIFGFNRTEIANIQNSTVTNVKIRLYRGRKKLEQIINK